MRDRDKAIIDTYTEDEETWYRVLAPYPKNVEISYHKRGIKTREEAEEYCRRHKWEIQE